MRENKNKYMNHWYGEQNLEITQLFKSYHKKVGSIRARIENKRFNPTLNEGLRLENLVGCKTAKSFSPTVLRKLEI